jgi:hypothetical protein
MSDIRANPSPSSPEASGRVPAVLPRSSLDLPDLSHDRFQFRTHEIYLLFSRDLEAIRCRRGLEITDLQRPSLETPDVL